MELAVRKLPLPTRVPPRALESEPQGLVARAGIELDLMILERACSLEQSSVHAKPSGLNARGRAGECGYRGVRPDATA